MPLYLVLLAQPGMSDGPDGMRFFREKIEPVLKSECYRCHSKQADEVQGGLLLDSRASVLRGGDSGPVVVAGKSGDSLLIQAIRHEDGLAMPPKKPKLPERTIADFVKWIEMGVPDPREGDVSTTGGWDLKEARQHWSFQPVRKTVPPQINDAAWVRTPIDAFFLAKLEGRQWRPAPPAGRAELIRRVSFDLIGLPPTPEEIDAFINDASPDAFERVVDRLLSSPHYGERWAQHWLDVVRYAETEGYEYDRHVPDAWRFRDYVIDSLNHDKPFDRFLTEQIAGDEIGPENPECLTASIFHRLGPVRRNAGNPDIALSRNEVLTERTDILGAAFLGLTVGCARCHNHKLEPISQKDYYRLQAYLAATEEHNINLASESEQKAWEATTQKLKDEIQRLQKQARELTGVEKEQLTEKIETLEDQLPAALSTIPSTRNDFAKRTAIHVLRRGVWENKGEPVGPRPLGVLVSDDASELSPSVTNPRTHLANWLTAADHPLTGRVIVNRIWQQHFGVGLVKTANDFGIKGERPSHPELLDWLAATLIENGWRLKPLHRLIVLSNTYQQSSRSPVAEEMERGDPENRLLSRFNRRRLSAEEIRDAMLAVSGRLNVKTGGPSVIVPVDPELVKLLYKPTQWAVTDSAREHDRRSVYLIAKRNLRLPFLENLDAPALQASCGRRESSTHAPQALELLNGTLSNDLASTFAKRLESECDNDRERIVSRAFRLALGRPPTTSERDRSVAFLREQPLREFAIAMFNLNGFVYVP
ncbi:MAG: DUF1553 domain-containing protein [Planctomycetales bacterium]|nr:DUF1553 domain-containing protein [Planctomycetales bacterium]